MDPLGNISPVMEVLRRQMTENLDRLRRQGATGAAGTLPRVTPRAPEPTLRQTLERRIRSLDPKDPHYRERAGAAFVESVLVAEFGEALVNDPDFRMLIRDVAAALTANPAVAGDMDRLLAELASGTG